MYYMGQFHEYYYMDITGCWYFLINHSIIGLDSKYFYTGTKRPLSDLVLAHTWATASMALPVSSSIPWGYVKYSTGCALDTLPCKSKPVGAFSECHGSHPHLSVLLQILPGPPCVCVFDGRRRRRGQAISAYHENLQLGLSYTPAVNPRCWSLNYCTLHQSSLLPAKPSSSSEEALLPF